LAPFWAVTTSFVYAPAVPVLLAVLAIAQMGVHLAFFLHISSARTTNNVLALLFGVFVAALVIHSRAAAAGIQSIERSIPSSLIDSAAQRAELGFPWRSVSSASRDSWQSLRRRCCV
jgi:hypothetical protein